MRICMYIRIYGSNYVISSADDSMSYVDFAGTSLDSGLVY